MRMIVYERDLQRGFCDICGALGLIVTTAFYEFPIACDCCPSKTHHHRVNACEHCTPVMPKAVRITVKVEKLLDPIHEGLFKKV